MSIPKTDALIGSLAREAGTVPEFEAANLEQKLLVVVALSLLGALALVAGWVGLRADLLAMVQRAPFHFKIASMLALACGGLFLVRRAARPGPTGRVLVPLLPSLLLLALGAAVDRSGLPLLGGSEISAPACIGAIVIVSLPALTMLLGLLRRGAPTEPATAGAMAGLLAGALGATAYTLACKNDGGVFVAIWYPVAILILAGLGAAIGRRLLAW